MGCEKILSIPRRKGNPQPIVNRNGDFWRGGKKSAQIPSSLCVTHCSHQARRCAATARKFTSEGMSSARWQDWGQRGQIPSDWKQAELTRILKERLMPFIVQQSGTFWHNQKKRKQQIGMLEHWRSEIKLSNVPVPWLGFQPYTSCRGGTWWGLIFFLAIVPGIVVLPSLCWLQLRFTHTTWFIFYAFFFFLVEANAFQTFPLTCSSPGKKTKERIKKKSTWELRGFNI